MSTVLIVMAVASVAVAIGMSFWTLRLAHAERRRSEARIALLEAELTRDDVDDQLLGSGSTGEPSPGGESHRADPPPVWPNTSVPGRQTDLFADAAPSASDVPRFAIVLVFGVLIVGALTAAVVVFAGAGEANSTTTVAGEVTDRPPLELTSLRHQREGSAWAILGLIRNPAEASPIDDVAAVTFLFDPEGAFVASGRAALEFESLQPGTESPFSVHVDTAEQVARYRIGFRTSDGSVIRHIDRRVPQSAVDGESRGEP